MTIHQVAVITGAASGIGFALAKSCQQAGMSLVLADINKDLLQERVKQLQTWSSQPVQSVVCDVSLWDDVLMLAECTMDHFGRVDMLFNNAGISGPLGALWDLSNEDVRQVMDVNVYGVLHGVKAFLPIMFRQNHRSHMVNMASFLGLCSGSQMAPYAMSKHAIVAMSESLYFDLQRRSKPVDVSVVCPSFVDTQLLHHSKSSASGALHDKVCALMARGRPADDVADFIVRAVMNKTFYILPDKEVKAYCQQRLDAIVHESTPHRHSVEKIVASL